MGERLKVLISGYACEPNKGSEPEVGWQWALHMAQHHDVSVLTRANNRAAIESALRTIEPGTGKPRFFYHDCGSLPLAFKKRLGAPQLYYLQWQRQARRLIAELNETERFDLLHHVTFAAFRFRTAILGHGVPTVWGPVGGAETIPMGILPWSHPASLLREGARNIHTRLLQSGNSAPIRRARQSTAVLCCTCEMQELFRRAGVESQVMPTIGLRPEQLPFKPRERAPEGPLRLLFTGNVIALKGLDLALDALKRADIPFRFAIVGSGNYEGELKTQAQRLGLSSSVDFKGKLPRVEVLKMYADFDLFIFPSLHDTGGYSVIEAMYNEVPVLCLDCAGPAIAVAEGCGTRIPLGSREEIVSGMAAALRSYFTNRSTLIEQGGSARKHVLAHYDWRVKAEAMSGVYRETVARFREARSPV